MNTQESKFDLYQVITDKIIAKLLQGFIPWRKPWHYAGAAANYLTKQPYKGINAVLLNMLEVEQPYFLTFKQAINLGGKIRKGAKSEMVTYWNWMYTEKDSGRKLSEDQVKRMPASQVKKMAFLRYYSVFNVVDVEGIDFKFPHQQERPLPEKIAHCEEIISGIPNPPKIQFGGNRAFYSPAMDLVNMPHIQHFERTEFYYSVFFHELTHSTGHPDRLARKAEGVVNPFGSEEYSKEELTAELGASFLCGITGIEQKTLENSAAYIQNWLQVLKNDKKMVVEAAGKAQQAADYLLNRFVWQEQENERQAA